MLRQGVKFPYLKRANEIPYFFAATETNRIFDQINNIKHLSIFKTAFLPVFGHQKYAIWM